MKEFNELINETNDTRLKVYFNLTELKNITGMSIRALKYRMLIVKKKYEGVPALLNMKNRTWKIHYTIVNEFEPKYNLKNKTIHTYNWTSMATWNPKNNYDTSYHIEFVNQIKTQLPYNVISYTVEVDGRGVNHTHLISDAETLELNKAVTSTLSKFIEDSKEYRIQVEPILNKYSAVEYLRKAPLASGIIQ